MEILASVRLSLGHFFSKGSQHGREKQTHSELPQATTGKIDIGAGVVVQ